MRSCARSEGNIESQYLVKRKPSTTAVTSTRLLHTVGRELSGTPFSPWSRRWTPDTTNGVRTICALVHVYVFYNVDRLRVYTAFTMAQ